MRHANLFAVALCSLASVSRAQQQVQFVTTLAQAPVPGSNTVQIPRFDSALGVLRRVELRLSGNVSGTLSFENTTASPTNAPPCDVVVLLTGTYLGGAFAPPPNPAYEFATPPPLPPVPLAAFDGVVDYAGTSGVTIPFTNETGTGQPSMTYNVLQSPALGTWVGPAGTPGTVLATIETSGSSLGILPVGIVKTHTVTVTITLTVTHHYDTLPAAICRAGVLAGCPCGNPGGIGGAGCSNSSNSAGAALSITGTASLSNDSLQLAASGMPNEAPVLYFQGTSFSYTAAAFGNGLQCVGGTLTRLGVKFNVAGMSAYPVAADPSISLVGGISAPGTRSYQAYYRDSLATCVTTFNLTNGYVVAWGP